MDTILKDILFENDPSGNLVPVKVQVSFTITHWISFNLFQLSAQDEKENIPVADLWTMDGRAIREVAQARFLEEKDMPVSTK